MKNYDFYYLAKRNLLKDSIDRSVLVGEKIKKEDRVHISAVCGKAMASIACILSQLGYKITASDDHFYPPMSDVLDSHNIKCLSSDIENLKDVDLIIPGNTLGPNHIEIIEAKKRNIPMISGAEVLGSILTENKRSLVVSGTHGKTTTSSLLVSIFKSAKRDPSFMIGGVIKNIGSYSVGGQNSNFAIFEGDEYDCAFFDKAPKFLRYRTTSAIITSIELDHIDLYPTFEDYKQSFQFLIEDLQEGGFLVCHSSVLNMLDVSKCKANIFVYDRNSVGDCIYKIKNITECGTYFDFVFLDICYTDFFVPLFGDYNIENSLSVIILSILEGLNIDEIKNGLENFGGVAERQEFIGQKNGIYVFRDFAHHPTALRLTMDGFEKRFPNKRIVPVFHPRSITSRRKIFEDQYVNCLSNCPLSFIIKSPFKEVDNRNDFIDVDSMVSKLNNLGLKSFSVDSPDSCVSTVINHLKTGDVVVFMSNSDLANEPQNLLDQILK